MCVVFWLLFLCCFFFLFWMLISHNNKQTNKKPEKHPEKKTQTTTTIIPQLTPCPLIRAPLAPIYLFFNFSEPAHHARVFGHLSFSWPFGPILVSHGGSSPNDLVNSTGIRKSPPPPEKDWSQSEAAGEGGSACRASGGQSNSLSPH